MKLKSLLTFLDLLSIQPKELIYLQNSNYIHLDSEIKI